LTTSVSKLCWLLLSALSSIAATAVSAGELTSSDLQRWLDPHNRADIGNFHQFLETIDAARGGGFDGIDGWRLDHSILFEGMQVKFVGATRHEEYVYLTLAKNTEVDVEAIAYRYFCDVSPHHLSLDFAFHETGKRHVVIECSPHSSQAAPYQYCIDFVNEDRHVLGSVNAIEGCKDLIFDFTTYTDKDVCLGFTKRKDFRDEERKRGLDCDAWFAAYEP